MSVQSFTQLDVYQDAEVLSDLAWGMVMRWDHFAKTTVGSQLVRAADSIGANIAEGWGRESLKEKVRFCQIARGSLAEVRHWLRRAHRRGLLSQASVDDLSPVLERLGPRLNAFITHLKRRVDSAGGGGVREEMTIFAVDPGVNADELDLEDICPVVSESTNQPINESTN